MSLGLKRGESWPIDIVKNGLWHNNTALVQLLGLCPLLAVTNSVVNGLGLAIATTLVLMGSNLLVSLVRHIIPNEIRIPIFVLLIASLVSCIQLIMQAFTYDLYLTLGIFIPLIVTNCMIIGRAEAFASRNTPMASILDALSQGVGFGLVLIILGAIREVLGQGTLFSDAELLLGDVGKVLRVEIFNSEQPFLLALLPPGAFIGLGILVAMKNYLNDTN